MNATTEEADVQSLALPAPTRDLGDWLLLILSAEKAVQHLFGTWPSQRTASTCARR